MYGFFKKKRVGSISLILFLEGLQANDFGNAKFWHNKKSLISTGSKMIINLKTKKNLFTKSHVVLTTPKLNCHSSQEDWLYTQTKPPMQAGNKIAWTNPSNSAIPPWTKGISNWQKHKPPSHILWQQQSDPLEWLTSGEGEYHSHVHRETSSIHTLYS